MVTQMLRRSWSHDQTDRFAGRDPVARLSAVSSSAPATRIANRLAAAGATVGFGVPGGGPNLDVVGAFDNAGIRFVLAHGETAAAIMAATFGHLTGTPTPVVVTRGPGATSVVNGAAQATLDRQPLVVITDTVPTSHRSRVPHQRVDQGQLFRPVAKASGLVGPQATIAEVDRLLLLALAEPPGAVHLDYDSSFDDGPFSDAADWSETPTPPPIAERVVVDPKTTDPAVDQMIGGASRPVVIIGRAAVEDAPSVRAAVKRFGAPVFQTYQGVGVVPGDHDLNGGLFTNGASERPLLEQADLIITIGLDMVEPIPAPWGYSAPVLAFSPVPTVDPYLPIAIEVTGPPASTVENSLPTGGHAWARDAGQVHRQRVLAKLGEQASGFAPTRLVETVLAKLPPRTITTVDAGAHFLAIMPFHPAAEPGDLLISNGLATMGYAVPAAIGASLAAPDRPVVAMVGDGGLSMTLAELETIVRLQLPITVITLNDSALSLIEIKQGANHGGPDAVKYCPTDFAAIARGMGMPATVVTDQDQLASALDAGFDGPRLVDARIDPGQYPHLIKVTRG